MTTAIFLVLFFAFLVAGLNFLPNATDLPSGFSDSVSLVVSYMKAWNFLFPITELMVLVGIVSVFYFFLFLWKALQWVLHIVRGATH